MENQAPDNAKILREIYNTAHDIVAVYNPTDEDFRLIFDQRMYLIPHKNKDIGNGAGIAQLNRYLAQKYMREMTNKILTERGMNLVKEENARRAEKGMALLTTYPGDNSAETIESQVQVNNVEVRKPVMLSLYKGLVQKSPDDLLLERANTAATTGKSADDQIFEDLENITFTPQQGSSVTPATPDIETAKQELISNLQNPDVTTENEII